MEHLYHFAGLRELHVLLLLLWWLEIRLLGCLWYVLLDEALSRIENLTWELVLCLVGVVGDLDRRSKLVWLDLVVSRHWVRVMDID